MNKQIVGRVQHKHDTEANWLKATGFIPLDGELIIYDIDEYSPAPRFKVGDGKTLVSDLPFSESVSTLDEDYLSIDLTDAEQGSANLINADSLGGVSASDYVLKTELDEYKNEVTTNVDDLETSISNNYLLKTETAADTNKSYGYDLAGLKALMLDLAHPVGSYYWSSVATDPSALFGGSWEQIKDQFILAAGDSYAVNSTGGAVSTTYTPTGSISGTALSISQIPSHSHSININIQHGDGDTVSGESLTSGLQVSGRRRYRDTTAATGSGKTHSHSFTGTAAQISTMPPYRVAYCWRRTA